MVASPINPAHILDSYRKSDAVIIVCQNNARKMVEIAALNAEAMRVTGYSNEELVGKPFEQILPERIGSTIAEFVEFGENANDLLAVLNKVRNFSVKTRGGEKLEFTLRIIRGEPIDRNPWFHLVLVDEEKLRKTNAFRALLKENFKGHEVIDGRTGLPDRASIIKDLELVVHSVRNKDITGSFAVLDINHYERLQNAHGDDVCGKLRKHIGAICKQKLRTEDTIGVLSDTALGVLLVDAPQEAAHMVLNRLRWMIGVTPLQGAAKEELLVQVNIGFAQIDGKISEADIVVKTEKHVEEMRGENTNSIQLVITHERREGTDDRRRQLLGVEKERRRKKRRTGKKG